MNYKTKEKKVFAIHAINTSSLGINAKASFIFLSIRDATWVGWAMLKVGPNSTAKKELGLGLGPTRVEICHT